MNEEALFEIPPMFYNVGVFFTFGLFIISFPNCDCFLVLDFYIMASNGLAVSATICFLVSLSLKASYLLNLKDFMASLIFTFMSVYTPACIVLLRLDSSMNAAKRV